jgi:hypothetical protein
MKEIYVLAHGRTNSLVWLKHGSEDGKVAGGEAGE